MLPAEDALDMTGLDLDKEDLADLLGVDVDGWLHEIPLIREYYARFGERMPEELVEQLDGLEARLEASR